MMSSKNSKSSLTIALRLFLCVTITMLFALVLCPDLARAETIKLSKTQITLAVGNDQTLSISAPSDEVRWTSSDRAIVTVSTSGKMVNVHAIQPGEASIFAKAAGLVLECKVVVEPLTISSNYKTVYVGKTTMLTMPDNVKGTTWSSSNSTVASVSDITGSSCTVTGNKVGTAYVTANSMGNEMVCIVKCIKPHDHNYSVISKIESTCTKKGNVSYLCECGAKKTVELAIDSNNHEHVIEQLKSATCAAGGSKTRKCADCGKVLDSTTISALGHDYIAEDELQAVCKCSRCGDTRYNYERDNLIFDVDFSGMAGQHISSLKEKAHGYLVQNLADCTFNNNGVWHTSGYNYPYCADVRLLSAIRTALTTGRGLTFEVYANVIGCCPAFRYSNNGAFSSYETPLRSVGQYMLSAEQMKSYGLCYTIPYITDSGATSSALSGASLSSNLLSDYCNTDVWHIVTTITPSGEVGVYINGTLVQKQMIGNDFKGFVFDNYPREGCSFDQVSIFTCFNTSDENAFIKSLRIYNDILEPDSVMRNYHVEKSQLRLTGISSFGTVQLERGDIFDVYADAIPSVLELDYSIRSGSSAVAASGETTITGVANGSATVKVKGTYKEDTQEKSISVNVDDLKYSSSTGRDYTGITIARKTDQMYVGDEFVCQAYGLSDITAEHPYRYGYSDENKVSYRSSNSSVCSVKNGVMFAHKTGTVTITVSAGSVEQSFDVTVKTKPSPCESRVYNAPVSFDTTDSKQCTEGIISVLESAHTKGYDKVIFPKKDYNVSPEYGTIYMPDNMIVDFGGSVIQIMPSKFTTSGGYSMFVFQNTNNSVLQNAVIYGERFLISGTGVESCMAVNFKGDNHNSGIYKCTISRSPGFCIGAITTNRQIYGFRLVELEDGGIASDGQDTDMTYTYRNQGYIRMPNKKWFAFGNMQGYQGYQYLGARLYNIYFYDNNYRYLTMYENCVQYYQYETPTDAQYCRISFNQGERPTRCDGDFMSIAHVYAFDAPSDCYIRECIMEDNYSTAIQPNAGSSWIIEDCVFKNNGVRDPASHIDWEDGRNNNKGHILRNCYFENGGAVTAVGADGLSIHNNVFKNVKLVIGSEVQNSRIWLNQFVGKAAGAEISTKTDMVFSQNLGKDGATCIIKDTDCCVGFKVWSAGNSFDKYSDYTSEKSGHSYREMDRSVSTLDGGYTIRYRCDKCGAEYADTDTDIGLDPVAMSPDNELLQEVQEDADDVEGWLETPSVEQSEQVLKGTAESTSATLVTGMELRKAFYRLANVDDDWDSAENVPVNVVTGIDSIIRTNHVPANGELAITISEDASDTEVVLWLDNNVYYWYSDATDIKMNSDSAHMLDGVVGLKNLSGLLDWNCCEVDKEMLYSSLYSENTSETLAKWLEKYQYAD